MVLGTLTALAAIVIGYAVSIYTGPTGAKGQVYRTTTTAAGEAVFKTTRALAPYEGLTVVVGWPKGFVREPSTSEKTAYFLKDNRTLLNAVIDLVIVIGYYLLVWAAVGKDPDRHADLHSARQPLTSRHAVHGGDGL